MWAIERLLNKFDAAVRGLGKTRGAIRFPFIFSPFLIKQKGNEE
jgi:hypothetical protein